MIREDRACPLIIADHPCPGPLDDRDLRLGAGSRRRVRQCCLDHLRQVPDPRRRRGIRHALASILTITAAAVLAGARSFTAVAEWIADAPAQVQAVLEVRHDPYSRRCPSTHEATIRRVLARVDADALDAIFTAWLAARRRVLLQAKPESPGERPKRQAIAVDGKALRGARLDEHQTVHLLSAFDHASGLVLAQTDVDGKTTRSPDSSLCWQALTWTDAS